MESLKNIYSFLVQIRLIVKKADIFTCLSFNILVKKKNFLQIETQLITFVLDLLSKVDPSAFVEKFGVDLSQANTLIEAKTLTISKLMTIMPQG